MSSQNTCSKEAQNLVPVILGILVAWLGIGLVLYLGHLLNTTPKVQLADYIQFLILLFIAGTMGVGIWGHRKNEEFGRSAAFLENATGLISRARDVLTTDDGELTTNRVSWVTAARLLTRAQQIASLISVDAHRKIFEAEHDYQRHAFGEFLEHNGQPLPAAFFCGSVDLSLSIGKAVCHSSQAKDGMNWIPPRIVAVVYRFFQYPDGYEDPLDSSRELSNQEKRRLWLFGQRGVRDYLIFRKHFFPVGKQIIQGSTKKSVDAGHIDAEMSSLSVLEE